jgi:hypothetical protein
MILIVKGLIQINIPYVDYFYKWKANKFIKTYTSLCQFDEVGKFKWPAANFLSITPHNWFNNRQYAETGSNIFSQTKQSFLVKCFSDKNGQKKEVKKQMEALRFWHKTKTWCDTIANIIKFKQKEKQQVLVIYQSDDNYTKMPIPDIPKANKTIPITGEHSLLFVFYLADKTEIYRINNAEIFQGEPDCPVDNKITYFYVDRAKLERI